MKTRIALFLCALLTLTACGSTSTKQAAQEQSPGDVVINIVGDVHGEREIKRDSMLTLKKYFTDGDLNIFNLETAVTDADKPEEKQYNFKTEPAFLNSLKSVGLNVATVANNHSYDFGEQGFLDTLQNLDKAGIAYVGGGLDAAAAYRGRVFTVRGLKIGILGFAKVNGGPASIAGKDKSGTTNGYDRASTSDAIAAIRKISDVVIILVHWGEEGSFCPRPTEISSAKDWITEGADIIVGSHTHTLQPISLQENKLIAYSMGNFIFYSSAIENRTTGILKIRISPTKRISYGLQPFVIDNVTKVPAITDTASAFTCENQAKTTVR